MRKQVIEAGVALSVSLAAAGGTAPAEDFRVAIRCDRPRVAVAPLSDAVLTITVSGNKDWRGTVAVLDEEGYRAALPYVDPDRMHAAGGEFVYTWDGADDRGVIVPSGNYTIRLEAAAVYPRHNWGGKWFSEHALRTFFDSRGEDLFLATVTSREPPCTDFETPEAYGRYYDFDGLPTTDLIPLTARVLTWGERRPAIDLHRNTYVHATKTILTGITDLCKVSPLGDLLWRVSGIVDADTGEPFFPDGSGSRRGRPLEWDHHVDMWDTSDVVYSAPFFTLDAADGTILRTKLPPIDDEIRYRIRTECHTWPARLNDEEHMIAYKGVRQFADGGVLVCSPSTGYIARYERDGTMRFALLHGDYNCDGDRYDGPSRDARWGENGIEQGWETSSLSVDAEGNFYGPIAGHGFEAHNFFIGRRMAKYNPNGQLILDCTITPGYPIAAGFPSFCFAVRQDGRMLATGYKGMPAPPWMHELAHAEAVVTVASARPPDPRVKKPGILPEPETATDHLNRARLLVAGNRDADALWFFLKVPELTKDPDYQAVALNLAGRTLERLDRLDEASLAYRKLCGIAADTSRGWINAARCHEAKGDSAEAETCLKRAHDEAPDAYWRAKALLEQGEFYERSGDHKAAGSRYDQVVNGYAHAVPQGLLGRARCLLEMEKVEDALEDCRRIVEHYPIWSQEWTGDAGQIQRGRREDPPLGFLYEERECTRLIAECAKKIERDPNTDPRPEAVVGKKGDLTPDLALGQKAVETCEYPQLCMGTPGYKSYMLHFPQGLFRDEHGLYVACNKFVTSNGRGCISIYQNLTGENGQPVDRRFGPGGHVMDNLGMRLAYADPDAQRAAENAKVSGDYNVKVVALTSDGAVYYLTDNIRHRVLLFEQMYREDASEEASFVLGQKDFLITVPNNGGLSASSLCDPYGIGCDGKRLYLADRGNHRVLIWNLPIKENFQKADLVLGQRDFTTADRNAGGVGPRSLNRPSWVFSDGKRLVVSDCGNNRVLIWNRIPEKNVAPADIVLGAEDFDRAVPLNILDSGYISRSSFAFPMGIWIEGDRLYVCDMWNNRVMIWDRFPTRNNQPADRIIGQPPMEGIYGPYERKYWCYGFPHFGNPTTDSQYTVGLPIGVCTDGERIYVSDYARCRVLGYLK